ncbi:hypothetical protein K435DRAFT_800430 [Dendrothele bispora CBS 962.96]|uniref:Uncharacterized protein n=1 Tax=Dendrothele bispora (strain CBS 962.96) TaxID=1314807 RepID=A0A4S8LSN0_DENBC|nr:hypothetical protein K435DRAFT_800430 [Dendrothele bispora CBS 962.96]
MPRGTPRSRSMGNAAQGGGAGALGGASCGRGPFILAWIPTPPTLDSLETKATVSFDCGWLSKSKLSDRGRLWKTSPPWSLAITSTVFHCFVPTSTSIPAIPIQIFDTACVHWYSVLCTIGHGSLVDGGGVDFFAAQEAIESRVDPLSTSGAIWHYTYLVLQQLTSLSYLVGNAMRGSVRGALRGAPMSMTIIAYY